MILKGAEPQTGRASERMAAVDFDETGKTLEKKISHRPTRDEILSYVLYPDVFLKFARARQSYGNVEVLPTPQFYYGMERGSDIVVELEPGKSLIVKFLTVGEPHPDGTRTAFLS